MSKLCRIECFSNRICTASECVPAAFSMFSALLFSTKQTVSYVFFGTYSFEIFDQMFSVNIQRR